MLIDDFRLYDSALTQSQICCYVCGNTMYYQNTLIASLFNTYVPLSTASSVTNYKIGGKSNISLSNVYAPYSSGTRVYTGYCTNIFSPWTLSSCRNYMSVEFVDNSAQTEINSNYSNIS